MAKGQFIIKCGNCGGGAGNIELLIGAKRKRFLWKSKISGYYVTIKCNCGNEIKVPATVIKRGLV